MKDEKVDILSGIIPLLFTNFWSGEKDMEEVIEDYIKEKKLNGKEQRKFEC